MKKTLLSLLFFFAVLNLLPAQAPPAVTTVKKYIQGRVGYENWEIINLYITGTSNASLFYAQEKSPTLVSMAIVAVWNDAEEKAIKFRVKFRAIDKDEYLVKMYTGTNLLTMEKIAGNLSKGYYRRFNFYN